MNWEQVGVTALCWLLGCALGQAIWYFCQPLLNRAASAIRFMRLPPDQKALIRKLRAGDYLISTNETLSFDAYRLNPKTGEGEFKYVYSPQWLPDTDGSVLTSILVGQQQLNLVPKSPYTLN